MKHIYIYIYAHNSPPTREFSHSEEREIETLNNCEPEGNSFVTIARINRMRITHIHSYEGRIWGGGKNERERERPVNEISSRIHRVTFTTESVETWCVHTVR